MARRNWQNEGDIMRHIDGFAYVQRERAHNSAAVIQEWWSAYYRDGTPMARRNLRGELYLPRFASDIDAMAFAEGREPRHFNSPSGGSAERGTEK